MTSYVLLAYTEYLPPNEARTDGSSIARWLVSQQTSTGGFSSTQVRGLQYETNGVINRGQFHRSAKQRILLSKYLC